MWIFASLCFSDFLKSAQAESAYTMKLIFFEDIPVPDASANIRHPCGISTFLGPA
jgi:hypothetical protein